MPRRPQPLRIAIDTGGTFTDCVWIDAGRLRMLKVFSTPADPSQAIVEALRKVAHEGELPRRTSLRRKAAIHRHLAPLLLRESQERISRRRGAQLASSPALHLPPDSPRIPRVRTHLNSGH